jgi:hypothetical protein
MPLLSYAQVRPLAKSIRQAVLTRKMPPWFADPHAGKFLNDRSLPQEQIDTLVAWADQGAKEGNPKDGPEPERFVQGWNIGNPDLTFAMPKPYRVPAKGTVEYTYYVIPMNLKEDIWVQSAEVRPGNRKVVHHVIAFIRPPGMKWLTKAVPGEPFVPQTERAPDGRERREGAVNSQWLTGYAPGLPPETLLPGQARLIPAGSDLVFQMHYTANGEEQTDQTQVGLILAKEPPKERVVTLASANANFVIPPGAPNHEVHSTLTLREPAKLVSLVPHMHLRGKAFEMRAVYPTGETELLLRVPRYDFNWQLSYLPIEQKLLPKGTKIECTAWFDNSPNNPHNPDPTVPVRFGEQSWEEMMIGFFDVAIAPDMDANDVMRGRRPARRARTGEE